MGDEQHTHIHPELIPKLSLATWSVLSSWEIKFLWFWGEIWMFLLRLMTNMSYYLWSFKSVVYLRHAFNTVVIRISRYVDFFFVFCFFGNSSSIMMLRSTDLMHKGLFCTVGCCVLKCLISAVDWQLSWFWSTLDDKEEYSTMSEDTFLWESWGFFLVKSSKCHLHLFLLFYYFEHVRFIF